MNQTIKTDSADVQEEVVVNEYGNYEQKMQVVDNVDARRRGTVGRIAQLIWVFFGGLEAVIGLRVILKLLAANPENPFARLIYTFTDFFVKPFEGLTITPEAWGIVFEIPALIAILAYALLGWLLVRLVWLLFYQPASRMVRTVERNRVRDL